MSAPGVEGCDRNGLADLVALSDVAPQTGQRRQNVFGLDLFGHEDKA